MKWLKSRLLLSTLACLHTLALEAAEIIVVNQDSAGFGFNDPTPATPVGGNPGTTLGEQRFNLLQRAGDIWGSFLQSNVPIRVQAAFSDLGGDENGTPLASASAISVEINFANAPQSGVIYPIALANSLAGVDLRPDANDINVTINIAPDTDPLLDPWYYGLDGQAPADQTDLLDVLLHEIGHGLGMTSFTNLSNGTFLSNLPDIYSLNLFDTAEQLGWGEMNNPQRKNSSKNAPNLVWTGPYTTAAQASILEKARILEVATPGAIAGEYAYEPALYGPPVPEAGISGILVPVDDGIAPLTDACEPITNGAGLAGNIAYIDRGTCNFDSKSLAAQLAGAVAVIIANNVEGGPVFMTGNSIVDGTELTIPTISISLEDGQALVSQSPGVTLTIGLPASDFAGTSGGFVRIYAPDPVEQGSSVSHWSTAASPDLLMEPFINPVLREDLDLSLTQMKDIGWTVLDIPYPYLNYTLWSEEAFSQGQVLTAQGDDPDKDGLLNIEEYFFGGSPESPSASLAPVLMRSGSGLELTYSRSRLPADLGFVYEVSSDFVNWDEALEGVDYISETTSPLGASAELVTLIPTTPPGGEKLFFRIRIIVQ
ncbi:peptidase [Puniceicoccales bacterium CK1056]|uniref:Peptidase n=1 Tax=Oceanipulchritudo coccoides TaxID=2706888 RepID=A0A6B2M1I3_9BACT|nr:PA domain-containing protein [Oceanipulchritudo coccoides]NDV61994.1 peptidase [Oceanipulchritudo coccoides]